MTNAQTIVNAVTEAKVAGEDPGLAAFLAVASEDEVHLAEVVACVIALPAEDAIRIAEQTWLGFEHSALQKLDQRPFVENVEGGLRLNDHWAQMLSQRFRTTDPNAFREVNEHLAQSETRSLAEEEDPEAQWFIRGRTAFYLAGIDPRQSVIQFGEVFTTPPVVERTARRLWLAALVDRQAPLLSGAEREVAFFRGFREYVVGQRAIARADFELVVASPEQDRYRAVALHLLGSMQRGRDAGLAFLRESVELSAELGIDENEIMARHTLSWALTIQAQSAPAQMRAALIEEGEGLADFNSDRADTTGDLYLITWCSRTKAAIRWLHLTNFRSQIGDQAREAATDLVTALSLASSRAIEIGELETACLAANDAVAIWRDIGAVDTAIAEAAEFLDALGPLPSPPSALENLAKTLGSMQSVVADATQADQLRALRTRLDRVRAPIGSSSRRRQRRARGRRPI